MNFKKHEFFGYSLLFIFVFLFSSCKKKEDWKIVNLNGGRINVIGHAGSGLSSPENPVKEDTFSSVINAVELYGAEGVEVDVHMSNDSVFYLLHDQTLEVSTNFQGCVYGYSASELEDCYFNFSSEKLSQLEKCLQHFSSYSVKPKVFFDTRLYAPCNVIGYLKFIQEYSNNIHALIAKYNAFDWVYIESRDPAFLQLLKDKSPQFHLLIDGFINTELDVAVNMGLFGIVVQNDYISKDEVALAHSKDIRVILYGSLNKEQTIDAIKKFPDMIQTDDILLLQLLLDQ